MGEYSLTVRDVPVDGFWSISLYNRDGFFEANERNAYSVNNLTATPNADGSVTVNFGGCDGDRPNCLPIMEGWNYTVRMYRPRREVLDGSWTVPDDRRRLTDHTEGRRRVGGAQRTAGISGLLSTTNRRSSRVVVTPGFPDGNGIVSPGARVALPLIPGDQLLARLDDPHLHRAGIPPSPRVLLRARDEHPPEAARLDVGADGKQSEVRDVLSVLAHVAACDHLAVGLDHQDASTRLVDQRGDLLDADPRSADQVCLGRPAAAARLAAVCGLDQPLDRRHVHVGREADGVIIARCMMEVVRHACAG